MNLAFVVLHGNLLENEKAKGTIFGGYFEIDTHCTNLNLIFFITIYIMKLIFMLIFC